MPDQFHTTDCKALVEDFHYESPADILIQRVPFKVFSSRGITLWAYPLGPVQYIETNNWAFWRFLRNLATAGCGIKNTLNEVDYVFLEGTNAFENYVLLVKIRKKTEFIFKCCETG